MRKLKLREEEFNAHDELDPWLIIKMAKATQSPSSAASLTLIYDFLMSQVVEEERPRLTDYLDGAHLSYEEINEGCGSFMAEVAERPTERPSSSLVGLPSQPISATSKPDSPSPGTDRTGGRSSRAGASRAS